MTYTQMIYKIERLYSHYQTFHCCNGHILSDPYLEFKWILGEEVIRQLMGQIDLHPAFNSDETTCRTLMGIPVFMNCADEFEICLIAEIK